MALNLTPLSEVGNGLLQGLDTGSTLMQRYLANKLNPAQLQLLQAQAKEAQGNALKTGMEGNILQALMGGTPSNMTPANLPGVPGSIAGGNNVNGATNMPMQNTGAPGAASTLMQNIRSNPALGAIAAHLFGLNQMPIEGGKVYNPLTGVATQVGEAPEVKRQGEATSKATQKYLENIYGDQEKTSGIGDSIQSLQDSFNNPVYKNIGGTVKGKLINDRTLGVPVGTVLQSALPKTFSKDEAELAGNVQTAMGNINVGFGSLFKGAYKGLVNGLITQVKPAMDESIPVQQGKLNAMSVLHQLGQQRKQMIEDLVVNQKVPPLAAIKIAEDRIPFTQIKAQVLQAKKEGQQQAQAQYDQQQLQNNQQNADQSNINTMKPGDSYVAGSGTPPAQTNMNEQSPVKIGKQHVTEENIKETMQVTGLSRKQVMKKLKAKGLV